MVPARTSTSDADVEVSEDATAARARASAMPAEERRAAILDATVPLLLEHGTAITTKQIAAAAGVAEGTIFRVFADKDTLVEAAVLQAFDPAPIVADLLEVDLSSELDERCVTAVEILQLGVASMWRILTAVGVTNLPERERDDDEPKANTIQPALERLLEPDRDRLRVEPRRAAAALRALTFASCHPALTVDEPFSPREIVAVVLDGVRLDSPCEPTC